MRLLPYLTILSLFIASCTSDPAPGDGGRNIPVPTVEAVTAQFGSLPLEERLTGSVRAFNQTDIYAELSGPITHVMVNNGDQVVKGQALVRIRDFEAQERLRQAEAALQIAQAQLLQTEARLSQQQTQLARIQELAQRELQSPAELEQLTAEVMGLEATRQLNVAQVNQASSVVQERENALDLTIVRAPISGIVGQRDAEVGQMASPATRLFQIGDLDRVRIQVTLTESMLSNIRQGMRTHLTSPAFGDSVITAEITRISPFLNPVTHTADSEIELLNPGRLIKPGMFVNVDIFYGDSEQATLVPNNALYRHPREGVIGIFVATSLAQELNFAYDENQEIPQMVGPTPVEFRRVEVVARGRMVTAVRGIDPQTHVITLGQNLMVDGSATARIRRVEWSHILDLQRMQSRDLIKIIQERTNQRSTVAINAQS